jgi:Fe-S cluster assembly scaffold protein SufB
MRELKVLTNTFASMGGDPEVFADTRIAHMAANGHQVLSHREISGVKLEAEETPESIITRITVARGVHVSLPIHLCIGIIEPKGIQHIQTRLTVEEGASAGFLAHCLFPNVESGEHRMDAIIEIQEGATVKYLESHYQGPYGGMVVMPHAIVKIGKSARYFSDFTLTTGRVGKLNIDYVVQVGENAVAELAAKVFGRGNDEINIKEKIELNGENSKGLIKTRVAVEHEAKAELTGIMEAHAKGARGHVDCREIVKDHAVASAIPIVNVTHPLAKVTHEAAIGSVDQKELETLMAHGLNPEQATELIVSGMLQ